MHRYAHLLCAISIGLLCSCSSSSLPAPEGTFHYTLSDEHNVMADPMVEARSLEAPPSAALEIDAKEYTFKIPEGMDVTGPNAIHLYQSESDNKFRCDWSGDQLVIVNADTLESFDGKSVFQGFQQGQSYIMAIGHDNASEADGQKLVFKPLWVATLDIAQP